MERLTSVYHGSAIYRILTKKKKETFFLFLPDKDAELNYYAVQHARRYAGFTGFSDVEIICIETNVQGVRQIAEGGFRIHTLREKQADALLAYVLLKASAMYFPILRNIRVITMRHPNTELKILYQQGFFDKEYLVWKKMLYCQEGNYEELIRTTPYQAEQDSHVTD